MPEEADDELELSDAGAVLELATSLLFSDPELQDITKQTDEKIRRMNNVSFINLVLVL